MHMAQRIANPTGPILLGRQIREARKSQGKSQKQLASEAGVDRTRLTKIEAGQFRTLNPAVQKICTKVGVDPEFVQQGISGELGIRLDRLSRRCPDVIPVVEAMVAVLEARQSEKRRDSRVRAVRASP